MTAGLRGVPLLLPSIAPNRLLRNWCRPLEADWFGSSSAFPALPCRVFQCRRCAAGVGVPPNFVSSLLLGCETRSRQPARRRRYKNQVYPPPTLCKILKTRGIICDYLLNLWVHGSYTQNLENMAVVGHDWVFRRPVLGLSMSNCQGTCIIQ